MSWHPFHRIDNNFVSAATLVAAVSRKPDTMDLFVTGPDGRVYRNWWNSADGGSADDWALCCSIIHAAHAATGHGRHGCLLLRSLGDHRLSGDEQPCN